MTSFRTTRGEKRKTGDAAAFTITFMTSFRTTRGEKRKTGDAAAFTIKFVPLIIFQVSFSFTRGANAKNVTFSTLYFATVSLRIYDEFQNDERGKEKDR